MDHAGLWDWLRAILAEFSLTCRCLCQACEITVHREVDAGTLHFAWRDSELSGRRVRVYPGPGSAGQRALGRFAWEDLPDTAYFPRGVLYQRAVRAGDQIRSKVEVTERGTLCDPEWPERRVHTFLNPFFFREAALEPTQLSALPWLGPGPRVRLTGLPPDSTGQFEFRWPVNPPPRIQWQLESTPPLQPGVVWTPETQAAIAIADGYFSAKLEIVGVSRFFRLRLEEPNPDIVHLITAVAGTHGSVFPAGSLTWMGGETATFTVLPDPGYGPDEWYWDGQLAQTGVWAAPRSSRQVFDHGGHSPRRH